jgi:lipopolysaccharide transport system ATP-binding protein
MDAVELRGDAQGRFVVDIAFDALGLLPGSYNVRAHVMDSEGVRMFDTLERGLTVRGTSREFGLVRLPHRWQNASGCSHD